MGIVLTLQYGLFRGTKEHESWCRTLWMTVQNDRSCSFCLLCKQLIHDYLLLYQVVVVVVGNTVRCYHDKMKGAFVLRQFAICVKLVLQVLSVIIVYGEGAYGMFHLADVRKAVGPLYD